MKRSTKNHWNFVRLVTEQGSDMTQVKSADAIKAFCLLCRKDISYSKGNGNSVYRHVEKRHKKELDEFAERNSVVDDVATDTTPATFTGADSNGKRKHQTRTHNGNRQQSTKVANNKATEMYNNELISYQQQQSYRDALAFRDVKAKEYCEEIDPIMKEIRKESYDEAQKLYEMEKAKYWESRKMS